MKRWLFLGGAIVGEVAGSLSLKAALDQPAFYALTAIGYVAAFVLITGALRADMPLGAAYGIWGASGVALTAILSLVIFGEPLSWVMGIGIGLVMAGVLCVELGSQAAARDHERDLETEQVA